MKSLPQLLGHVRQLQEELQKGLAEIAVEASAGGGMVTVAMNGQKQLTRVRIDPELLASPDRDMLQDLVLAAVNEASRKVDAELAEQMNRLSGGLPFSLPGLF